MTNLPTGKPGIVLSDFVDWQYVYHKEMAGGWHKPSCGGHIRVTRNKKRIESARQKARRKRK